MAMYVLVAGAWCGGWAWKRVARDLRAAGHDVYTPTLTGLGERVHLATPDVDLDTHINDIINVIGYEDLRDVVLVGHSYAGIVVEGVADRIPERLAHLVYLDAGPFGDGMAHLDFYPPEAREQVERVVDEIGDGWRLPFPNVEDLGQQASLAGLGEAERRLMAGKATPQPFGTYLQPLMLSRGFEGEYRQSVVLCSDGGFSVSQVQELIAAGDPRFETLAEPDWCFFELATGHWPMLSMPAELAGLLHRIVDSPSD